MAVNWCREPDECKSVSLLGLPYPLICFAPLLRIQYSREGDSFILTNQSCMSPRRTHGSTVPIGNIAVSYAHEPGILDIKYYTSHLV